MGTIAELNELTTPDVDDYLVVRDMSDVTDKDKKMKVGTFPYKFGTPVAGRVARWKDANTVEDAGFLAADIALKFGTPVAGRVAQWKDANTVEGSAVAVSDLARLSTAQTFSALKTFSAGLSFGQANNLAYYDEGTWTPVVASQPTGGVISSVGSADGFFVRVGSIVTIWCNLQNINTSGQVGTDVIYVRGAPFVVRSVANMWAFGAVDVSRVSFSNYATARITAGSSAVNIFKYTTGNFPAAPLTFADLVGSNSSDLTFTVSYVAA